MSSSGTKSTSNDSSTYVLSPSELLDSDSEVVSSSHELLNSSPSRTSLTVFPCAWLRTHLIVKSALLPLNLRPCCFKCIFSWLFLVSTSTSFSFFQEILDGRVFLSPTLFFTFASKNSRYSDYITFTHSLVLIILGTELLQRPFFRGGKFSLIEQFLYLDTREKFVDVVSTGRCHGER